MASHARTVLATFPCIVLQRGFWALLVLQVWMLASLLLLLPSGSTPAAGIQCLTFVFCFLLGCFV